MNADSYVKDRQYFVRLLYIANDCSYVFENTHRGVHVYRNCSYKERPIMKRISLKLANNIVVSRRCIQASSLKRLTL